MKGIILAGGAGTRLHPLTIAVSKQLLPVYDKPMVYYPLSVLMLAGIKDILVITTPHDHNSYTKLLGDGSSFGININYAIQEQPDGLAQSFIIGKNFINTDKVSLILGDNIFYGQGFSPKLKEAVSRTNGATIFGYEVKDPGRYGVVEFDNNTGKIFSIEEKPEQPKSNIAVTGLYFYDNSVVDIASEIKLSKRGELEITSVNQVYMQQNNLFLEKLTRGFSWFDAGTHKSLLQASQFIESIESTQGYRIACLEEISFQNGWISKSDLEKKAYFYKNSLYGSYLLSLLE
jgi:glucose-1-phosphate thymidylyltransferase